MNQRPRPDTAMRPGGRYSLTAQALHWLTAALMFTVLPVAWVMVSLPEAAHSRGVLFTIHKSVGLSVLALVAIRLAWRVRHPAPPLEKGLAAWEKRLAFASHWILYAILVGMPLSGYLLDAAGGYPISYFGLFSVPILPKSPTVANAATWMHVVVGQWLVYALVTLHLAASVWHVAVRRDGVLNRMLPEQK